MCNHYVHTHKCYIHAHTMSIISLKCKFKHHEMLHYNAAMIIILKNWHREWHHFTVWLYGDRTDDVRRTLYFISGCSPDLPEPLPLDASPLRRQSDHVPSSHLLTSSRVAATSPPLPVPKHPGGQSHCSRLQPQQIHNTAALPMNGCERSSLTKLRSFVSTHSVPLGQLIIAQISGRIKPFSVCLALPERLL